jgi:fructan beta-fructosidase
MDHSLNLRSPSEMKPVPGLLVRRFAICIGLMAVLLSAFASDEKRSPKEMRTQEYRPQFHFTPAQNWMNDPNGTVYYKGEYHLFYQYNPFGADWGHMSWGHAVSRDLVHWKDLPLALAEENGIMIFSGSVVVDWHNSSGFCRGHGADPSCLVAIYSGSSPRLQTQNIAYSNDNGRTWTKYSGNPVIDLHLASFRDPKVFWHDATKKWVMVTALGSGHKVRLFNSPDLVHWTALAEFGPMGAVAGAWECPDLFPLAVENSPGETKWVLSVSVFPSGLTGGPGNQYFIGDFDGTRFSSEQSQTLWADYGKDFYASTSFSDIPQSDGRRLWIGWLNNWEYGKTVPTTPWRGMQSIPRELRLRKFPDGIRLVQFPVGELSSLRKQHIHIDSRSIESANRKLQKKLVHGETLEILAEIEIGTVGEIGFKLRKGTHQGTIVGLDAAKSQVFVDRAQSGNVTFAEHFAGRQTAPITIGTERVVQLHIFLDRSSVEVFADHGSSVLSEIIFPLAGDGIELYAKEGGGRIRFLDIWKLESSYK